jgi:type IV secretory pathway VirB4 component
LLGGEYHDVGSEDAVPLCPLALLDRPTGLQYLMGWFERLFFRRKGFELDEAHSKDLRNALQDVRMRKYDGVTSPKCRHLWDLYARLPTGNADRERMRAITKELIEDYGHIFGGEPVEATNNRITVYELSNLDTAPKYISTPATELILYNTMAALNGKPGFVFWDEFWSALSEETSLAWFFKAIRTMRRLNCGFVGFSQSSVEITESPYCNLMLGNMPGKLFFPDDSAATPIVSASLSRLGLNPQEVSRIAGAKIGEFFYKSSQGSRLASAWLGPIGRAICASTNYQSVEAMRELLKQCKPENLLDEWLRHCGVNNPETMEAA